MNNKVTCVKEFYDLLENFTKEVDSLALFSNIYLLKPEIEQMVEQGLLVQQTQSRLLFLYDKGGYYQCLGIIKLLDLQEKLTSDMPIVFDLDFREELTDAQIKGTSLLEKLGFKEVATSVKLHLYFDKLRESFLADDPNITIRHAVENDLEAVDMLWGMALPPNVYLRLSTRELETYIENGQVLIAIINSKIVGALQYEVKRGVCLFHHVAVDQKYRGHKVATRLVRYALELAKNQNARSSAVWVVEENQGALLFYENIGYRKETKHTKRFILEEIK